MVPLTLFLGPMVHMGTAVYSHNPTPNGLGPAYEYPNGTQHVAIIGAFPYQRGPLVWNDTLASPQPFGGWGLSTGWTYNVAHADTTSGKCPPIPDDAWGRKLDRTKLWVETDPAVPEACFIACNRREIEAGAPDPCNAGSVWVDTPRFGRVLANFSCFYGGPGCVCCCACCCACAAAALASAAPPALPLPQLPPPSPSLLPRATAVAEHAALVNLRLISPQVDEGPIIGPVWF